MRRFLCALATLLIGVCAWAHDPQLSGIGIAIKGDSAMIAVQVHLSKLGTGDPASLITNRLALSINGQPFAGTKPDVFIDSAQGVAYWRALYNGPIRSFQVAHRLFPEDNGARTIVSVTKDGESLQETIVDASHPAMLFGQVKKESAWSVISQFWQLGIMHIFTGPDHILFIFGLILLGGGLRALLKTVTAFTVAHSITLTVAATGLWAPPSRFVEPLIALSIVAVAFENLRKRKDGKDWRPLIAFGFGLIHGFGFAGGLTEAGLPHAALGWALASFNVGVECAQACIVLAATPLLAYLAANKPKLSYRVVYAGSILIALAGAFWFIDRVRVI
jgi:hydrogenase/urease accessory protein HupE